MTGTEVDMVEHCKEHYNASTKICNGESIQMNADHFGIVVTLIIMAIFISIIFISQINIQIFPTETAAPTTLNDYCEKLNLKC